MTFREVESILNADNWKLVRIVGSHHQFKKEGASGCITVPKHGAKDIAPYILKNLERKTGLPFLR